MISKSCLIIVLFIVQITSQHRLDTSKLKESLLLDANYSSFGVVSHQGEHVYLRVYSSGIVEYEVNIEDDYTSTYKLTRKQISEEVLQKLKNLLNANEICEIGNSIILKNTGLDYSNQLSINLNNNCKLKPTITDFDSVFNKETTASIEILQLMCIIENIRKDANYSVIHNTDDLCK